MGVGAGLYMYIVVVQKFTFAISSPDEFLLFTEKATFPKLLTFVLLITPAINNQRYKTF